MTDRKPVFIEKIMPVKLLNEQVYYENGGNPFKGLHRWYSRKPLSFSRASVLGSLLPADVSMEEFEYLLGLDQARTDRRETEKEKDDRHQRTRLYKTPPSPERVKRVQELCEQMWGNKTPAVLDAFAGGGSIPFEAARYGLRVFASDLNPVAVVTMKAAIAFPLQFGAALQEDIDKWVKWVGDEAEKRLSEFFPVGEEYPPQLLIDQENPPQPPFERGEQERSLQVPLSKGDLGGFHISIQNYLWAHTVVCPSCQSVVPLSPNWWLDRSPSAIKKGAICAVKPIPNLAEKRVDFELIKGKKGKGNSIQTPDGEYDPDDFSTMSRGVGKCPNCESIIEDSIVKKQAQNSGLGHQLYAVAFKKGQGTLEFRTVQTYDLKGFELAEEKLSEIENSNKSYLIPDIPIPYSNRVYERDCVDQLGLINWKSFFNSRQLLTLVTYVEIINEAKEKIREELGDEKLQAITTYLALVLDRCADRSCRLARWDPSRTNAQGGSAQHALNLMWNYPESSGYKRLWEWCAETVAGDYQELCDLLATEDKKKLFNLYSVGQVSPPAPLDKGGARLGSESPPSQGGFRGIQSPLSQEEPRAINIAKIAKERNLDYSDRFLPYNKKLVDRAKELRKNMTQAEKKLWHDYLKNFDDRVWRQRPIDHFIVDFYCPKRYLVIEVDGDSHFTEEGQASDIERTQILEAYGLKVLRFTNDEVLNNFEAVCEAIGKFYLPQILIDQGNPPQPPFERGEQEQSLQVPLIKGDLGGFQITHASADDLFHLPDQSIDAVVTDPPYYSTIQYAELSDFFYVWQKRILGDIFPELYYTELTDKDREAVANPSRFRDMGVSPKELADRDYEAKMQSAFGEYYRVLKDNGVMTVQFNHKDSGAWDVLAQSLITAGFEITASWAVSTENPQNLHQAQKNSVSSTVLLICRKRDPNAGQAWWDDLRPEVANLVEQRAPEFEANEIQGIDLYLSAFGPALNVFSRNYPILDSTGEEVRPEVAFAEARKAVANYRFRKLAQTDTAGFDPLTQWYFLAWDAFQAREFPFDDARQLALAVGGFNVADLGKTYKLLDIKSGTCKLLSPEQRYKKHAFSLVDNEFSARYLIDGLHAITAIYLEEQTIEPVRRFIKATGLLSNDMFMRAWEVALRVIPHISDPRKRIPEEKALADLWLAMDEIKAKVSYVQPEIDFTGGQMGLDFDTTESEEE